MKDKWDLQKIYATEEAFNQDLAFVKEKLIPSLASRQGKLAEEKSFVAFLLLERETQKRFSKLYLYSGCASDLNKKDVAGNERLNKVELLSQEYAEKMAWSDPEFLGLGLPKIKEFLSRHAEVKEFDYSFEKLFFDQSHILSADKEQLLSAYRPLLDEGSKLYSMLSVGDYTP